MFSYLQQFIGDMKRAEIRRFLRFTTGSSVLLASNISVAFNSLSGLARRPIAHTCSSTLELSSTYINYLDLKMSLRQFSVMTSSLGKCMQFKNLFSWFLWIHQYSLLPYLLQFSQFQIFLTRRSCKSKMAYPSSRTS